MQIQFHPEAGETFQRVVNSLTGFAATITTENEVFNACIIRADGPTYNSVIVRRYLDAEMIRMDNAKTVRVVNIHIF